MNRTAGRDTGSACRSPATFFIKSYEKRCMEKRFAAALLLAILVIAGVPAAAVAVLSPSPSVPVVCTPPPCSSGSFTCPPEGNGCPGGCGVVCVTPAIVCTPPPCPAGGTLTCPPAGNGCPGGCGAVCVTPTTPSSPCEPLVVIAAIGFCLMVICRKTG